MELKILTTNSSWDDFFYDWNKFNKLIRFDWDWKNIDRMSKGFRILRNHVISITVLDIWKNKK